MAMHSRLRAVPKLNSDSVLKAEFSNGSRMVAPRNGEDGSDPILTAGVVCARVVEGHMLAVRRLDVPLDDLLPRR
jgi:hypothetical protein